MTVEANIGKRTKIWHPDLVNIYMDVLLVKTV